MSELKTVLPRTLRADEIECRVGRVWNGGFSILLYKDARCDMAILDETVGPGKWQREHKELGGTIYCGVSIWSKTLEAWVTKWDAGTESRSEPEKGQASDSFKRACVNWGIGRELYTAPFIAIKAQTQPGQRGGYDLVNRRDAQGLKVESITYSKDRRIDGLVITRNGETVYTYGG